jgi:predicted MFS family arabinose efflux permease
VSLLVAATIGAPGLGWALALALVLAVGGLGFGVFTASAFAQILARVRPEAASSLSGLLPTAQQLGGTVGVALAGVVYYAPAPDTGIALWHAMTYEAVVFVAAAGIAAVLARARPAGPPDVGR